MASCFRCGAALPEKIFRQTTCESCGADAKVCLNCTFYDPSAHWECRETIPEAVRDKDRANFCDYFRPTTRTRSAADPEPDASAKARDSFSRLFGDE